MNKKIEDMKMFEANFVSDANFVKYPDGYLPKIAYHMHKGNVEKMLYFTARQKEVYGAITYADQARIAEIYNAMEAERA